MGATWELQRREDAGEKVDIPVPPKYTTADFAKHSYWPPRGKLDVPKERFVSYPRRGGRTPPVLGWAGWDHLEQARALARLLMERVPEGWARIGWCRWWRGWPSWSRGSISGMRLILSFQAAFPRRAWSV